ncbi:MAG: lipopolysaccharide biosynthesis protein [Bacteroidales bacterium]
MFKKNGILIIKSEFIKNVFTLLSGATVAQIIALISIPILTRIYTPEDFGFFAIYLSIANIISTIATGRFELAIMLPEKKENAIAIVKGIFRIALVFSFLILILLLIVKNTQNRLSEFIHPFYFYFLPLRIFTIAFANVFTQWYTREKKFKLQAKIKIYKSGSNAVINIFIGLFYYIKSLGLFFGHIVSQVLQVILFALKFYRQEKVSLKNTKSETIKKELKENRNFPFFSAPMGFLNAISSDILIYVLNLFYSTTLVGFYTNANKVINYPLSLISQSFTSVFYQKINESNKKVKLYLISYFSNFVIASVAMIPVIFWGEEIFGFVLGSDWEIAGSIAKYLAPLTIAGFAMRSVSNIFSLTRKNGILLIWQIVYLAIILIMILISKSEDFKIMLISVSIAGAVLYITLAVIGYRIMKINYPENV